MGPRPGLEPAAQVVGPRARLAEPAVSGDEVRAEVEARAVGAVAAAAVGARVKLAESQFRLQRHVSGAHLEHLRPTKQRK